MKTYHCGEWKSIFQDSLEKQRVFNFSKHFSRKTRFGCPLTHFFTAISNECVRLTDTEVSFSLDIFYAFDSSFICKQFKNPSYESWGNACLRRMD